jgi:transposase
VFQYPTPSREGWPVTWVFSALLALCQERSRRERIARAIEELADFKEKLRSPRSRIRNAAEIEQRIKTIVQSAGVASYVKVERTISEAHTYRQKTRGRPGPNTEYNRKTRCRNDIAWHVDECAIAYDRKSDGMYPLLTNDRSLSPRQVLQAHKEQPKIEKRFQQMKTVHEIAPVFLKNEGRVEALFFLYLVGLLTQALIERELRNAMVRNGIEEIPLYPEERQSRRPTTEQIFRLFSLPERHVLSRGTKVVQVFDVQMTDLQRQVLGLLGIPECAYIPAV